MYLLYFKINIKYFRGGSWKENEILWLKKFFRRVVGKKGELEDQQNFLSMKRIFLEFFQKFILYYLLNLIHLEF